MKFHLLSALIISGLVGCATPARQADIDQYAKMYAGCYLCSQAGLMDQETAAKGMAFVTSKVYPSDAERVRTAGMRFADSGASVNADTCSSVRLNILRVLAEQQMAPIPAPVQSSSPTHFNCLTTYGFTHCY